jgi:GT2 family glycosyltransferase
MNTSIWILTGGADRARVQRLVNSLPDVKINAVNYGMNLLNIDRLMEYRPCELPCPVARDTMFTANFNRVLWHEFQGKADAALILNDDVEFLPGAYDAMIAEAEKYPGDWLSINPLQLDHKNPLRVIMAGTGRAYPAGVHIDSSREKIPAAGVSRFRWLPFCAPLLNLNAVRSVGLLDPMLRMWFSDSDYCTRGRYFGFDTVLAYSASVLHINHATAQAGELADIFRSDLSAFARKWNGDPLKDLQ